MAGTRADIATKTVEQFVSQSSDAGTVTKTLDCGTGYIAFSGTYNQATLGVTVAVQGVPGGFPSQFRFTVAVAAGTTTTGEDGPDNDQAEDPQPKSGRTDGNVKLFVTCLSSTSSAGDTFAPVWTDLGSNFYRADFRSPDTSNRYISGNRYRRIVINNDSHATTVPYSGNAQVPAGKTLSVDVTCPHNTFGNFALRGTTPYLGTYVLGSEPRGNKWTFTLTNPGLVPNPVSNYGLGVVCIQPKTAKQRSL